jgi:peptidoglycan hydrolase CwlO-like protein
MEAVMAVPARKIEVEVSVEARIARLESDTAHIQSDVHDIRQDMKGLRQEMKELVEKVDITRKEIEAKFDAKFGELQKAIESINVGRAWDRVWLLTSMGALLVVMARGFKWI